MAGRAARPRCSLPSECDAAGHGIGTRLAGVARGAAGLGDGREDRRQIARVGEVAAPHAKFEPVRQREGERSVELVHRTLELVREAGGETLKAIDQPRRAFIELDDVEDRAAVARELENRRASGRERGWPYGESTGV